jgi:hypothetical protein
MYNDEMLTIVNVNSNIKPCGVCYVCGKKCPEFYIVCSEKCRMVFDFENKMFEKWKDEDNNNIYDNERE